MTSGLAFLEMSNETRDELAAAMLDRAMPDVSWYDSGEDMDVIRHNFRHLADAVFLFLMKRSGPKSTPKIEGNHNAQEKS